VIVGAAEKSAVILNLMSFRDDVLEKVTEFYVMAICKADPLIGIHAVFGPGYSWEICYALFNQPSKHDREFRIDTIFDPASAPG